jgi:hypothetical protein
MKPFMRRVPIQAAKDAGLKPNEEQYPHYPPDVELFDWNYGQGGSGMGTHLSVAFDFPILLPSTHVFVHQQRPEDDSKPTRFAQIVGRHGFGPVNAFWWGQECGALASLGFGFHTIVVPCDVPVHVEAILPTLIHEQLVQV